MFVTKRFVLIVNKMAYYKWHTCFDFQTLSNFLLSNDTFLN